jgi:hypothetical protein
MSTAVTFRGRVDALSDHEADAKEFSRKRLLTCKLDLTV